MRIALINNLYVDHLGFYYISAVARAAGCEPRIFLTDRHLQGYLDRFDPELFAFTATTGNHGWVMDLVRNLRRRFPGARYILGGPHATYYPEIAESGLFDVVVRGEGEETLRELLQRLRSNASLADLRGAWVLEEGRLHRNPMREAPQDLDSLPFPDRSLYDDYPWLQAHRYPMMLSSRGCPFRCTFCYSPTLMDMMKGNGRFVRFRSVDNLLTEGQALQERHHPGIVEFVDDIFGMHRHWLREFAARWKTEVGLPFNAQIRADLLDEESVELLAQAGCNALNVGVEAGNDRIRNEVLQKDVSRAHLFTAARLLRKHRIRFVTLNIMGSPGETLDNCIETIELNQALEPDYAHFSVLVPFPKTGIYQRAVDAGQIETDIPVDRFSFSFFERSPLIRDDLGGIVNLQRVGGLAVRRKWSRGRLERIGRQPERTSLYLLFLASHFLYFLRVKRVRFAYLMRLGLNIKEILRRHRAGVFARFLPGEAAPDPEPVPAPVPRSA